MTTLKQKLLPATMQGGGFGGLSYLLRDEFSDVKAAGAVNGTPAVPGPGTRTEGGDAINSISNGEYVWAQWTTVRNTLAYADVAILLSVGRCLLWRAKVTGGSQYHVGFDASLTPQVDSEVAMSAGGLMMRMQGLNVTLRFLINALFDINIGIVHPNNNNYQQFAIVIGANRGYLITKWDTDTQWLLRIIRDGTIAATAFVYWSNNRLTTADSDGGLKSIRVPQSLYIPTPLAYAAFGGANGPLGNTDAIGPDGQGSPVLAWVDQVGTWAIVTNKATASALAGGLAIATVPTASADAHIRIALTRAGGSVGGVARYQDSSNYLRFSHDGTNALCGQVVAGAPTTLRTGVAAFVADALIYLIVSGTTGWLFYNNVAIGASFTVPASTQKNHGLYTTDVTNTMDAFEAFPNGAGGEHGLLGGM
jgi:hypothetical protein